MATAKVTASTTAKSVQTSSPVSSAKTTLIAMSWSNGTTTATATSGVLAASGSGASATGTGLPVVATNGAEMRSFAKGVFLGSVLVAIIL